MVLLVGDPVVAVAAVDVVVDVGVVLDECGVVVVLSAVGDVD